MPGPLGGSEFVVVEFPLPIPKLVLGIDGMITPLLLLLRAGAPEPPIGRTGLELRSGTKLGFELPPLLPLPIGGKVGGITTPPVGPDGAPNGEAVDGLRAG